MSAENCPDCGEVHLTRGRCSPPLPAGLDTLDFAKAGCSGYRHLNGPLVPWAEALNAQCAALIAQAREEERGKCDDIVQTITEVQRGHRREDSALLNLGVKLKAERELSAPLVALVREWQAARNLAEETFADEGATEEDRSRAASAVHYTENQLAAFDLGKEG